MKQSSSLLLLLTAVLIVSAAAFCGCVHGPSDDANVPPQDDRSSLDSLSDGTAVPRHYYLYYRGEGLDESPAKESARMLAANTVVASRYGLALSSFEIDSLPSLAAEHIDSLRGTFFMNGAEDLELSSEELCEAVYGFGTKDLADVLGAVKLADILHAHILSEQESLVTDEMIEEAASKLPSDGSSAFLFAFISCERDRDGNDRTDFENRVEDAAPVFDGVDSPDGMLSFIYDRSDDPERYESNVLTSSEIRDRIAGTELSETAVSGIDAAEEGEKFTIVTSKGVYYFYCIGSGGETTYDRDALIYEIARQNAQSIIGGQTALLLKQEQTDG
ncbi:MAG: hypothetical protein IKX06_03000 [Clostridia bacterium]|nr:hypothetical protein [Clostridia bacterium]